MFGAAITTASVRGSRMIKNIIIGTAFAVAVAMSSGSAMADDSSAYTCNAAGEASSTPATFVSIDNKSRLVTVKDNCGAYLFAQAIGTDGLKILYKTTGDKTAQLILQDGVGKQLWSYPIDSHSYSWTLKGDWASAIVSAGIPVPDKDTTYMVNSSDVLTDSEEAPIPAPAPAEVQVTKTTRAGQAYLDLTANAHHVLVPAELAAAGYTFHLDEDNNLIIQKAVRKASVN